MRLFLLGGLWRTLSLCLHSPLISRSSQPYHHCCGSGRPWYADTRVERDGLSHSCLLYNQRWTHWAFVKYEKKNPCRVSLSIGVRTTMICWVVYLLRISKMFHGHITLYKVEVSPYTRNISVPSPFLAAHYFHVNTTSNVRQYSVQYPTHKWLFSWGSYPRHVHDTAISTNYATVLPAYCPLTL